MPESVLLVTVLCVLVLGITVILRPEGGYFRIKHKDTEAEFGANKRKRTGKSRARGGRKNL